MNYYEQVRDAVERIAECTTSDAQGIIEAWERTYSMRYHEEAKVDPEDLARAILKMPNTGTTEGKHTPGPWSVEADKARNNLVVSSDTTGDVVCEVVSEPGSDPVAEANARLIAAAPELLEAAAHVLAKLDHPHASVNALDCEMLRKAIAAATNA